VTGASPDPAREADWPRDRLDRDYRARDCVTPEAFERIIGAYRALSADAVHRVASVRGLRYDADSDELLDLWGVGGAALKPAVLCIHGGFWRALSRADTAFMAPALARNGIVTIVPDYTLAPAASLSEIVRQMRAALAFVWHRAEDFGIDRRRILVTGSSAGGHLAACLVSPGWQAGFGLPPQPVHAAMPISGLFDLAPIAACHVQEWMNLSAAEVEALSPLRAPPAPQPRMVVAVAETETPGFHRQSAAYAHRLGVPLLSVSGRNHFDIFLDLADPDSQMFRMLCALLE